MRSPNWKMNPEPPTTILPWGGEPPASSAELCLYLIMILPDIDTRRLHIKDFCRLYDIKEKREESRLSALTKQASRSPE
jgi:hypothetical protein